MDDSELLKQYLDAGSTGAFSQLMSRHLNMVYAAARRQVQDPHLADDITQAVFLLLSQKARKVHGGAGLPGWLLITTHYVAKHARKIEARRKTNEHKAAQMADSLQKQKQDSSWQDIFPDLDSALAKLNPKDRSIVALHFMEGRTFREVGHTLGISEDAARLASARAVLKLRQNLNKKSALSSTALATLIATHGGGASQTAPAALARLITANTLGTVKPSPTALLLAKKTAATLQLKTALTGAAILSALLVTTTLTSLAIFHAGSLTHSLIATVTSHNTSPSPSSVLANFDTGGSIELIAITKLPLASNSWWADTQPWWSPSGASLHPNLHAPHIPEMQDGTRESRQLYEFAFRATDISVTPDQLTLFATGEPDGCYGITLQPGPNPKDGLLYATALVYPEQIATNLCLRLINTPYEKITVNADGSPRDNVSSANRSFFPTRPNEKNGQAYVAVHPGSFTFDYHALALSHDGSIFLPPPLAPHFVGQEGDGSANMVVFFGVPQSSINSYQFQIRKSREWVTFRHVSLRDANPTSPFAEKRFQLFEPDLVTNDRSVKAIYDRIVVLIKQNDSDTAYNLCLQLSDELKSRQVAVRGTDDAYLVDEGEPILAQLQQALSQKDMDKALSLVDSGNGNGHRICHMVYMLAGIPKSEPPPQ